MLYVHDNLRLIKKINSYCTYIILTKIMLCNYNLMQLISLKKKKMSNESGKMHLYSR